MKLRDYLSIPYILQAQPVEVAEGNWVRQLCYPELGDFSAEGFDVEQVFLELERMRFNEIVGRVRCGNLPPVPRQPLKTADPGWWARRLGIDALVDGMLDKDVEELIQA